VNVPTNALIQVGFSERMDPQTVHAGTFVVYPQSTGVPIGAKGAGQIRTTSFSVPAGSLGFWRHRLAERRVAMREVPARFGDESIECADPSGLVMELVANSRDHRTPWLPAESGLSRDVAVRGLHSVTMILRDAGPTVELMTSLLNFTVVTKCPVVSASASAARQERRWRSRRSAAPSGRNGLGTVHHVAMAIASRRSSSGAKPPSARPQSHRGTGPAVLPIDLFPRTRRRAVRGGHDEAGIRVR
jgi:glyoxalase family protein